MREVRHASGRLGLDLLEMRGLPEGDCRFFAAPPGGSAASLRPRCFYWEPCCVTPARPLCGSALRATSRTATSSTCESRLASPLVNSVRNDDPNLLIQIAAAA